MNTLNPKLVLHTHTHTNNKRRLALKAVGGSAVIGGLADKLPGAWQAAQAQSWQKPVIQTAELPGHSQISAMSAGETATTTATTTTTTAVPAAVTTIAAPPTMGTTTTTTTTAPTTQAATTAAPTTQAATTAAPTTQAATTAAPTTQAATTAAPTTQAAATAMPVTRAFTWSWTATELNGLRKYHAEGTFTTAAADNIVIDNGDIDSHTMRIYSSPIGGGERTLLHTVDLTADGQNHAFKYVVGTASFHDVSTDSPVHFGANTDADPPGPYLQVNIFNHQRLGPIRDSSLWALHGTGPTDGYTLASVGQGDDREPTITPSGVITIEQPQAMTTLPPVMTTGILMSPDRWFTWEWSGGGYRMEGEFRTRIATGTIVASQVYYHVIKGYQGESLLWTFDLVKHTDAKNHDFQFILPTLGATGPFGFNIGVNSGYIASNRNLGLGLTIGAVTDRAGLEYIRGSGVWNFYNREFLEVTASSSGYPAPEIYETFERPAMPIDQTVTTLPPVLTTSMLSTTVTAAAVTTFPPGMTTAAPTTQAATTAAAVTTIPPTIQRFQYTLTIFDIMTMSEWNVTGQFEVFGVTGGVVRNGSSALRFHRLRITGIDDDGNVVDDFQIDPSNDGNYRFNYTIGSTQFTPPADFRTRNPGLLWTGANFGTWEIFGSDGRRKASSSTTAPVISPITELTLTTAPPTTQAINPDRVMTTLPPVITTGMLPMTTRMRTIRFTSAVSATFYSDNWETNSASVTLEIDPPWEGEEPLTLSVSTETVGGPNNGTAAFFTINNQNFSIDLKGGLTDSKTYTLTSGTSRLQIDASTTNRFGGFQNRIGGTLPQEATIKPSLPGYNFDESDPSNQFTVRLVQGAKPTTTLPPVMTTVMLPMTTRMPTIRFTSAVSTIFTVRNYSNNGISITLAIEPPLASNATLTLTVNTTLTSRPDSGPADFFTINDQKFEIQLGGGGTDSNTYAITSGTSEVLLSASTANSFRFFTGIVGGTLPQTATITPALPGYEFDPANSFTIILEQG